MTKRHIDSHCKVEKISRETQTEGPLLHDIIMQTENFIEINDQIETLDETDMVLDKTEYTYKRSIIEIENEISNNVELTMIESDEDLIENVEYLVEINETIKSNEAQMYRCFYCKRQLKNFNELQSHLIEHNAIMSIIINAINFYRCSRCHLIFLTVEQFLNHLNAKNVCTNIDLITAQDNCIEYQFLGDNFNKLMLISCQKMIDNNNNLYSCEYCENVYENFDDLCEHSKNAHFHLNNDDEIEIFENLWNLKHGCGICGEFYLNLKNTLIHIYFHQKQFKCSMDDCANSYKKFAFLNRHLLREHFNRTPHKCNHCEFENQNYELLKKHQRNDCKQRNYKCSYCGVFHPLFGIITFFFIKVFHFFHFVFYL